MLNQIHNILVIIIVKFHNWKDLVYLIELGL